MEDKNKSVGENTAPKTILGANKKDESEMVSVFIENEEGSLSDTKTLRLNGDKCVVKKGEFNTIPKKFAILLEEKSKIRKLASKHLDRHDASKALKKI